MAMPVSSFRAADMVRVCLPLSKSMAARALVATFWSGGCLDCMVLPDCSDTRSLQEALVSLRASLGGARQDEAPGSFYLGEGAASLRFFLPVVASLPGVQGIVDCAPGLRKRPVAPLLTSLRMFGATVAGREEGGSSAPYLVRGERLRGGCMDVDASISSQFVSALMLTAPVWEDGLTLSFGIPPVSYPYIKMTAEVMRLFGARVDASPAGVRVEGTGYAPTGPVEVESDWSAASYFYEYLLCSPSEERALLLSGLLPPGLSLQGDSRCAELMETLGVSTDFTEEGDACIYRRPMWEEERKCLKEEGVYWDLGATPDLVPAFAVGCCVAGIPYRFTGIAHLRHKECDRLAALVAELGKFGFRVEAGEDWLMWKGVRSPAIPDGMKISTYGDHRMAMAFGAVGLPPGVVVESPEVVVKSFPGFWREISKVAGGMAGTGVWYFADAGTIDKGQE